MLELRSRAKVISTYYVTSHESVRSGLPGAICRSVPYSSVGVSSYLSQVSKQFSSNTDYR
jgi:hypothetical protein